MVGRDVQYEFLMDMYQRIAVKMNCKPSDVEEVYRSIFKYTKRAMALPQMPDIYLTHLGKVFTSAAMIRSTIKSRITLYRNGKITADGLGKFMATTWPVYKLAQEKEIKRKKK